MASRKEQKEQARAKRLEQERQASAKSQQRRRYMMLGGVVGVAVVVIIIAIVVSSGGGKNNTTGLQTGHTASKTYATVNNLLDGIPQSGVTLGNPHAPVTMTYFGDLQCPICRDFTLGPFPQFVQQQVRTGKVKVDYRSFCTATGCPTNRRPSTPSRSLPTPPASKSCSGIMPSSSTTSRAKRPPAT